MNVENFWRQLKHDYLHNVLHPRLDRLIWILIYKVTPAYIARTEVFQDIISDWICNCGRQKYDRHHLCKHLVQAVGTPSINFWSEVYRRRVLPIYRHPELEPDGNIIDGDDHIWMGDRQVLGGGGTWKSRLSAENIEKTLGRQKRDDDVDQWPKKNQENIRLPSWRDCGNT